MQRLRDGPDISFAAMAAEVAAVAKGGASSVDELKGKPVEELRRWVHLLRRLAGPVVDRLDLRAELEREAGRPWSLAGPLVACRLRRTAAAEISMRGVAAMAGAEANTPDIRLWWGVAAGDSGFDPRAIVDLDGQGPLLPVDAYRAIEVWVESELAAVHALSHFAMRAAPAGRKRIESRIRSATDWHIEHTQPDNATAHPWALHVFLTHGTPEGRHFAETLLGNCLVKNAEPDWLSALILLDSAESLSG